MSPWLNGQNVSCVLSKGHPPCAARISVYYILPFTSRACCSVGSEGIADIVVVGCLGLAQPQVCASLCGGVWVCVCVTVCMCSALRCSEWQEGPSSPWRHRFSFGVNDTVGL